MRQPYLTAQPKETLNPHVRQWILTILVPLGGMYSYSYDPVVNDALLESLFNFDDPEVELSKNQLYTLLRKEYRRGCSQLTQLPKVLHSNIAQLAQLVSLNNVESSILEFA